MALLDIALYGSSNSGALISTLPDAFGVKWQDERNGMGSFEFALDAEDPAVSACLYGRCVRHGIASAARWTGIIDKVEPVPISEETEGRPVVTVSGAGIGIELDEAKTRKAPSGRSPGAIADIFPPIDDRPMEWYGMDFDDSSGWVAATVVGSHGESSSIYPGLPGGMRTLGASWIWSDDVPGDDFLFFREWVFLYPGFYCLDFAAYDAGCFINGRRHSRNAAYGEKERVEFTVINGGYIMLAFEADLRDTDYDRGLIWQITEGQDGDIVYGSGTGMKVYNTPDAVLSMTSAEILLALKNDHPSLDDWTFYFTAAADSASATLADTHAVAARIGDDSLWDILQALSEVYIDFDVGVMEKALYIWEKDTHSAASSMPIVAGGTIAAETEFVNLVDLDWRNVRAEFNALMVRYESGWFEYPDVLPTNPRWGSLGIEHVASGAIARQFAAAVMSAKGVDQSSVTFKLVDNLPDAQLPYVGFDKWSLLNVPTDDDLDATTEVPVNSITCTMDDDGNCITTIEAGSLAEEYDERIQRWISRSTRGGLSGLVQMAQGITATQQQRIPGLNQTEVVIFDTTDGAVEGSTTYRTMPLKGVVHKLIARVLSDSGGTTSVLVGIGGAGVTLSGTTGSGFQLLDIDESLNIPVDPRTEASLTLTTLGHAKVTIYAAISESR